MSSPKSRPKGAQPIPSPAGEVLSRLLGLLLAGVGMSIFLQGLFLQGLAGLGVLPHHASGGH